MTEISEKELCDVSGGVGPDVKIKTLEGDNDEYKVSPSDKINELIDRYAADKKPKP